MLHAVYLFGTYDQLNVGASAGLEALMRRVCQILEAYKVDASKSAWHAVKHFVGTGDALDPVPLSLRQHNAKKVKEEVDSENARFRSRGLQPPADNQVGADGLPANNQSAPSGSRRARPKRGPKGGPGATDG